MTGLCAHRVVLSRQGRCVLRNASMTVMPGEMVALVGPNGAGKSTLLRCLAGELAPDNGACFINGMNVHTMSVARLARLRAVLPQDAMTRFPLRVEDVVTLARAPWRRHATPQQNERAVFEAVAAAGVSALMQRDYRRLSGGERQRVQMARVLAQIWDVQSDGQPRFLLLDEPTSSLDIGHQQRLLNVVRGVLAQGVGVLAVLHDLNLAAAYAERVCLLADGHMRADGVPADVINGPTINAAYATELDVDIDMRSGRPMVLPARARSNHELPSGPFAGRQRS